MTQEPGRKARNRGWEKRLERFSVFVVVVFALFIPVFLIVGGGDEIPGSVLRDHGEQEGHDGRDEGSFLGSFAFMGLLGACGLLAALTLWAHLRRRWEIALRHVVTAGIMMILLLLYINAFTHGTLTYRQFTWNRAFANTSVVLYAATLAIGPFARLWAPAKRAIPWRRETGVWGTYAAILHVGIYWEGRFGWEGWRQFFYAPGAGDDAVFSFVGGNAFHVANVIGLVALAYALVLAATSNETSRRWLNKGWSFLQARATTLWILVLLHAWIFAYFVAVGTSIAVGTLWAAFWTVLLLQTAAFIKTVLGSNE